MFRHMAELKTRILVVDDDQRLRELLVRYLGGQGFEVRAVPDAGGMDKQLSDAAGRGRPGDLPATARASKQPGDRHADRQG